MFSSLGVDNVRGRWGWGAGEGGAAAPSYGNYVTFWGKMLIMIRATTEKTLQNNTVGAISKSRKYCKFLVSYFLSISV